MTEKRTRLNGDDWIAAGFLALTRDGPKALKAEPLARELGTTKGSFYWHFKDLPEFHSLLIREWEAASIAAVEQIQHSGDDPVHRLHQLGNGPDNGSSTRDHAMRIWAKERDEVAAAVARVDTLRLHHLQTTLTELDLPNPDFARIVYGAYTGFTVLSPSDNQDSNGAMSTLLAALLALRDA